MLGLARRTRAPGACTADVTAPPRIAILVGMLGGQVGGVGRMLARAREQLCCVVGR
jgi:hypothetical protein